MIKDNADNDDYFTLPNLTAAADSSNNTVDYPIVYDYLCNVCGASIPLPYRMTPEKTNHIKFSQWWEIHKNHKQYCGHCRKHVKVSRRIRGGY